MRVNNILDTNRAGIDLIKRFEGFRSDWYKDPVGIWTVGYGTTERVYKRLTGRERGGEGVSRAEASRLLERYLARVVEPAIEQRVKVPLTKNQFSALASFIYNVGTGAFARSTLLKKLNGSDYEGAASEFKRWNKGTAGGKKIVLKGLTRRRAAEQVLFETPDPERLTPAGQDPISVDLPPTPSVLEALNVDVSQWDPHEQDTEGRSLLEAYVKDAAYLAAKHLGPIIFRWLRKRVDG